MRRSPIVWPHGGQGCEKHSESVWPSHACALWKLTRQGRLIFLVIFVARPALYGPGELGRRERRLSLRLFHVCHFRDFQRTSSQTHPSLLRVMLLSPVNVHAHTQIHTHAQTYKSIHVYRYTKTPRHTQTHLGIHTYTQT